MRVLMHDKIECINNCERSGCHGLPVLSEAYSKRWFLKIVQVNMKHDPFDTM